MKVVTMHKILLGVLLLPALAQAEPVTVEKPVICDKTELVLKVLRERHGEIPVWIGSDAEESKSNYVVMINRETASWTLIQYNPNVACVLGSGEGFRLNVQESKRNL